MSLQDVYFRKPQPTPIDQLAASYYGASKALEPVALSTFVREMAGGSPLAISELPAGGDFDASGFARDLIIAHSQVKGVPKKQELLREIARVIIPKDEIPHVLGIVQATAKELRRANVPGDKRAQLEEVISNAEKSIPMPRAERQVRLLQEQAKAVATEVTPRRVAAAIIGGAILLPTLATTRAAAADGSGDSIVVVDTTKSSGTNANETAPAAGDATPTASSTETDSSIQPNQASDSTTQAPVDRIADIANALGATTNDKEVSGNETPSTGADNTTAVQGTDSIATNPSGTADTATVSPTPPVKEGDSVQTQPDVASSPSDSPQPNQTPTASTETSQPSQTETPQTPPFAAPKEDAQKPSVADRVIKFFGWGSEETTKPSGTGVTEAMSSADASLNDPSVTASFTQGLPTYGEAGPVVQNLPGAGAVTRTAGETPEVAPAEQQAAAETFGETVETLASIVQTPPAPEAPSAPSDGNNGSSSEGGTNTDKGNEANGQENLNDKAAQIQTLHNLAKNDPANWKNRAYVMEYLLKHTDLNIIQISGMIGNFCKEVGSCDINPGTHQKHGPAIGIAQWDSRKQALFDFADEKNMPWDSIKLQAMFIVHELKGEENGAYKALLKTETLRQATDVVLNKYERPAARILGPRYKFAKQTYKEFANEYKRVVNDTQSSEKTATIHLSSKILSSTVKEIFSGKRPETVKRDVAKLIDAAVISARDYTVSKNSDLPVDPQMKKFMEAAGYDPTSAEKNDCLKNVTTWFRVTVDEHFNPKGQVTEDFYRDIIENGAKVVGDREYKIIKNPSLDDLEPGDALLGPGHAALYTGSIRGKHGIIYGGIEAAYGSDRVAYFRDGASMLDWMKNNLPGVIAIRLMK